MFVSKTQVSPSADINKQVPTKVASAIVTKPTPEKAVKKKPQPKKKRPVAVKPKQVEEVPVVKPVQVEATPAISGCSQLQELLIQNGLSSQEAEAALQIATKESTCNSQAVNASSGACNFFQEFPCGKWGGLADINAHIRGADSYAKVRYGSWSGALAFWQNNHWW